MFQRRLTIIYVVLCAGFFLIALKLFGLQVLHRTDEDPDAVLYRQTQWDRIVPYRGKILDRRGVVLVEDRPTLELAVQYSRVLDYTAWLAEICRVTGRSEEEILTEREDILRHVAAIRARVGRPVYEEKIAHTLLTGIPPEAATLIECNPQRFPGFVVRAVHQRWYSRPDFAPHVIGYLGRAQRPENGAEPEDSAVVPGDRTGITGIEKQFNRLLHGTSGVVREEADPVTGVRHRRVLFPAEDGASLYLTLDRAAQERAEQALAGQSGAMVVMDVQTGEVLVLASSPGFDLTRPADWLRSPDRALRSRALQDGVPSGSIIKPYVALAAGVADPSFNPATSYVCTGALRPGGPFCSARSGHGRMDLRSAISHSCNVYFWNVGMRVGAEAIVTEASALGLGRRTGIELPSEFAGRLIGPVESAQLGRSWGTGDTLNLSIGQGSLLVTPVQIAVGMAAIANGGRGLQPRIVQKVDPLPAADAEDVPLTAAQAVREIVLPPEYLQAVRDGMRGTAIIGTARDTPELHSLNAALKTGTAQTNDPQVNQAWAAGYVPYDSPRYAFAVVIHNTPLHGNNAAKLLPDVLKGLLSLPRP